MCNTTRQWRPECVDLILFLLFFSFSSKVSKKKKRIERSSKPKVDWISKVGESDGCFLDSVHHTVEPAPLLSSSSSSLLSPSSHSTLNEFFFGPSKHALVPFFIVLSCCKQSNVHQVGKEDEERERETSFSSPSAAAGHLVI